MRLDQVQYKIKQTILQALDRKGYLAEVEIHYMVKVEAGYEIKGHYTVSTFLGSSISEGGYEILIDENLEILEFKLIS